VSAADLRDPQVLRDLRRAVMVFLQRTDAALDGSTQQVRNIVDWLRYEQLPHWKRQLAQREELYQQARRTWLDAEADVRLGATSRGPGRPSALEERFDMDKARRRRDEAQERLDAVKRCVDQVERHCNPLTATLRGCGFTLQEDGMRTIARLDAKIEAIETYLRQDPGT